MKLFLISNWQKLSISISVLIFSFGFAVFALKYNSAYAHTPSTQLKTNNSAVQETFYVVAVGRGIYEVKKDSDGYEVKWIRNIN